MNNAFNCTTNLTAGVYVETLSGTCRALLGIHISSKLLSNWLWATFELQNTVTNPNRCKTSPPAFGVVHSWPSRVRLRGRKVPAGPFTTLSRR